MVRTQPQGLLEQRAHVVLVREVGRLRPATVLVAATSFIASFRFASSSAASAARKLRSKSLRIAERHLLERRPESRKGSRTLRGVAGGIAALPSFSERTARPTADVLAGVEEREDRERSEQRDDDEVEA